jgi:DNA-directed RNA polymerase specialized sigma24 family protein
MRWDIKDWIERMAKDALCGAGRKVLGPIDAYRMRGATTRKKKFVPHRVTGGELITTLVDEVMRIYKRDNLHLLEAHDIYDPRLHDYTDDLPRMDLAWVENPKSRLFSSISTYERFLLYLSFKEGLSVRAIGEKLGRTKDMINRHIRWAITKLRRKAKQ